MCVDSRAFLGEKPSAERTNTRYSKDMSWIYFLRKSFVAIIMFRVPLQGELT